MKKFFCIVLLLLFYSEIFGCAYEYPMAYLNNKDFEYNLYINIPYELNLLGKHFFPDAVKQRFCKKVSDRNKVIEMEIRHLCKGEKAEKINEYIKNFGVLHEKAVKGESIEGLEFPKDMEALVEYEKGLYELAVNPVNLYPAPWKKIMDKDRWDSGYRTTWVLFMLGNINIAKKPEKGHEYYKKLRNLATDHNNFQDQLGLAYDSFYNEYAYTGDSIDKLRHALYCFTVYSETGVPEDAELVKKDIFQIVKDRYIKQGDYEKLRILKDPVAREIVLLVLNGKFERELTDVEKHFEKQCICTDRLAFMAYRKGDMKTCMDYLALSPDNSMMKLWILGRVARQEKKYAKAAEFLKKWLELYNKCEKAPVLFQHLGLTVSMKQDVMGLLGSVQIGQQDFSEALYTFMLAEDQTDAVCLVEQVMDTEELKRFCRNHCNDPENKVQSLIRHALAKRLMRAQKLKEAVEFFPDYVRPEIELYCELSKYGNNQQLKKDERGIAFMKMGMMARKYGDRLFGTELQPDYILFGYGDYQEIGLQPDWYLRYGELFSWKHSLCKLPEKRWHYRYLAAELFGRAASLAESADIKVLCYYLAVRSIGRRDPRAADIYYKMLCDCYPHQFAKETIETRWVPSELPPELQLMCEEIEESFRLPEMQDMYKFRKSLYEEDDKNDTSGDMEQN